MRWVLPDWAAFRRRRIAGSSDLRHAVSRGARARQPGQSLAEAALTAMISIMTVLATLQISLVVAQAFSAMYVAQTTARWLAVRIDTLDDTVKDQAITFSSGLPGMSGGGLTRAGVSVTPSCTALNGAGKCANRDSGDAISVSITANLTPVMFLPTTFGTGNLVFRLPTTMPTIRYTVLLE
jgi:hypothetical protein